MMALRIVSFLLCLGTLPLSASEKILRWGGDVGGSVPYLMLDANDPHKIRGFEYEVAEALAKKMGMKAEFVQHQWDNLIPGLTRGSFDIVLNAIEITEERKLEVNFSIPYFLTFEQLTVRADNNDIHGWKDLSGKKVGTNKESYAERLLQQRKDIIVASYEDQTPIYDDLVFGRLDAVLYDQPVALYYGSLDKRIKNLDTNFGNVAYGICVRKGEDALLKQINTALEALIQSGELRHIYERWGIWNEEMAKTFKDKSPLHEEPIELIAYKKFFEERESSSHRWEQIKSSLPLLLDAALVTLKLSCLAMICAVLLGLLIALCRLYGGRVISFIALSFVEIIRGTPLLIQLFLIYYGLPNIGIKLDPFSAAIIGLALNYSAYESEIYRTGILAIPHAQMETAIALGMNRWQALRHIILPQALRTVLPPMTNDFIALLKDSSLVSVISLVELTRVYGQLAAANYNYLSLGLITALIYFLMGLPFVRLSRKIENKLRSR